MTTVFALMKCNRHSLYAYTLYDLSLPENHAITEPGIDQAIIACRSPYLILAGCKGENFAIATDSLYYCTAGKKKKRKYIYIKVLTTVFVIQARSAPTKFKRTQVRILTKVPIVFLLKTSVKCELIHQF